MSQFLKTAARPLLCVWFAVLVLRDPALTAQGFQSGLRLCVGTVLPALFPFFVVCDLLVCLPLAGRWLARWARVWGLQNAAGLLVILLSWVGGYAVCARLTGQLYAEKRLSRRDAARVMLLGCCSGPGFVIGCVGGLLLGNLRLGVLLYGLQLAANLLSAIPCLPLLPKNAGTPTASVALLPARPVSLPQAIGAAVDSGLQVCGCVVFFRVAGAALSPWLPALPWGQALASTVLEITAGCADWSAMGGRAALYGCCLCMSVLGLSVWAQLAVLLRGAVSLRLLAFQRLVHLVCFVPLVGVCARCLPGLAPVYRSLAPRVIPMNRLPLDAGIVAFVFVGAVLYKVRQNFYNG